MFKYIALFACLTPLAFASCAPGKYAPSANAFNHVSSGYGPQGLGHCQGDCDDDNECHSGMTCGGGGQSPGCAGSAGGDTDLCYDSTGQSCKDCPAGKYQDSHSYGSGSDAAKCTECEECKDVNKMSMTRFGCVPEDAGKCALGACIKFDFYCVCPDDAVEACICDESITTGFSTTTTKSTTVSASVSKDIKAITGTIGIEGTYEVADTESVTYKSGKYLVMPPGTKACSYKTLTLDSSSGVYVCNAQREEDCSISSSDAECPANLDCGDGASFVDLANAAVAPGISSIMLLLPGIAALLSAMLN